MTRDDQERRADQPELHRRQRLERHAHGHETRRGRRKGAPEPQALEAVMRLQVGKAISTRFL